MKRIVLKIGSAILSEKGRIVDNRVKNIVEFIYELKQKNIQIILVSSGAVASGSTILKLDKNSITNRQVMASIGQPLLMKKYKEKFEEYSIICSQILLEASIFKDTKRLHHAQDTIEESLKQNIVPIINENDVTAVEELVFGDNDQLAAHVTVHFKASMLIILSDIDGYYDDNPHKNIDAKCYKNINMVKQSWLDETPLVQSEFGTGGIITKLRSAKFILDNRLEMFLGNGFDLTDVKSYFLHNIHRGGTLFQNIA